MHIDKDAIRTGAGRETIQTVSKVVLAIASILFVAYLATFIPGLEHVVPATGIGAHAVIGALVTVLLVALLIYLASGFARLVQLTLEGPPMVVTHVASIVRWTILLAAVVVAHRGLSPLFSAILGGTTVVVDLFFLLLAVPVVLVIALRLYLSLDPATRYIADAVAGPQEPS
ncbi:MAG: hypothetical protein ACOC42_04305 [Halobacteriota archaeon]